MTTIIVTGANGQLGNEIRELAAQLGSEFQLNFTDVDELDITNASAVQRYFAAHRPHFVINCAAYTAVDKAERDSELAHLINATAVAHLTQGCKEVGAKFIHISTDYVFDGKACTPYRETDSVNPQSVYGLTKQQGEANALSYEGSLVLRTSWLYSNYGNNFVKTVLRLASAEHPQLRMVFDQAGTPTNAADLASCIFTIIGKVARGEDPFKGGIYHFSNEGVCSWYDFAREILRLSKCSCGIQPIESSEFPTPATRPCYSVLNKAKIKAEYGIVIPHWADSLAKLKIFAQP